MEKVVLEQILAEKGIACRELAEVCGISLQTFKRKLDGKSEFSLREIELIVQQLSLNKSEAAFIFFGIKVS